MFSSRKNSDSETDKQKNVELQTLDPFRLMQNNLLAYYKAKKHDVSDYVKILEKTDEARLVLKEFFSFHDSGFDSELDDTVNAAEALFKKLNAPKPR